MNAIYKLLLLALSTWGHSIHSIRNLENQRNKAREEHPERT